MFCQNCGEKLNENADICVKCGSFTNKKNTNNNISNIPEEYKPIGMWGYFGYQLLFAIPLIGFIFLLVFSFGGSKNINLRNFARSYFCFLIIGLVICLICYLVIFSVTTSGSLYY